MSLGSQWRRVPPGSAEAYAYAACFVVIATLLRWGLGHFSQHILPFPTYFPAALFATVIGGPGVGVFATVTGGIIGWLAFMSPQGAFFPGSHGQEISLAAYLCASLLIVWGADHYRRITKRLRDEENFRKLTVEELAHRLKNKIATIQSVISLQLRDSPEIRDAIMGRLSALSATDDLILATQGQGAHLRDILSAELGPYETSRIAIDGPVILLPPKFALMMALLVHELATNSAKYGALSIAAGRVAIRWSLSNSRLDLEWREGGGPLVATPSHRGFGMRLLQRALEQFDGTVETTFEPTGLICKLSATVPDNTTPSIVPEVTPARGLGSV
jgi:two-component sensor histidine kinase